MDSRHTLIMKRKNINKKPFTGIDADSADGEHGI